MNRRDNNRRDALLRIRQFLHDHPELLANARVATLLTALIEVTQELDDHTGEQLVGQGTSRGGTADRRRVSRELRKMMRLIADIAKVLDPAGFPGIAAQLRMPRGSHQELEVRANSFAEVIAPIRQEFVDRMMPEDFDQRLQALIERFAGARNRKQSGLADQVSGIAGIAATARRGMRLLRELDAILSAAYANNPASLASWKSAARVQHAPKAKRDEAGEATETVLAANLSSRPTAGRDAADRLPSRLLREPT